MHRPTTFNDMILFAERADQAFMADRNGILKEQNFRGYNNSSLGNTTNANRGGYNHNNR